MASRLVHEIDPKATQAPWSPMSMKIAGGLYRERCEVPYWSAVFGSGGRAAAAVSEMSPGTTLHTYADSTARQGIELLGKLGVNVVAAPRSVGVAFAYFHPLSKPFIEPSPSLVDQHPPLKVQGPAVLRFGLLEGDAIVSAGRAVYDPQTWREAPSFRQNGSSAEELAIVLNELELKSAVGIDDLDSAATELMMREGANVLVVKGGPSGATTFERGRASHRVPAFRSDRVFKIGTGDVFSAVFAHYWAEKAASAVEAAELASRAVATYCNNAKLPTSPVQAASLEPLKLGVPGAVEVQGAVQTIGDRYTLEEARHVLRQLGANVLAPALEGETSYSVTAILVVADSLGAGVIPHVTQELRRGVPIVVLAQTELLMQAVQKDLPGVTATEDFASAIYFAVWASTRG